MAATGLAFNLTVYGLFWVIAGGVFAGTTAARLLVKPGLTRRQRDQLLEDLRAVRARLDDKPPDEP